MKATDYAKIAIERLEESLKEPLKLAQHAHIAVMKASEEIGNDNHTGHAHACLALMEVSTRALSQANDAARYSRHSLTYPRDDVEGASAGSAASDRHAESLEKSEPE